MKQERVQSDEILKKLESVEAVEPSHFMYAKILHKIEEQKKQGQYGASYSLVWKIAFGFALLLVLNVTGLFYFASETTSDDATAATTIAQDYGLTADNDYYNYSE